MAMTMAAASASSKVRAPATEITVEPHRIHSIQKSGPIAKAEAAAAKASAPIFKPIRCQNCAPKASVPTICSRAA